MDQQFDIGSVSESNRNFHQVGQRNIKLPQMRMAGKHSGNVSDSKSENWIIESLSLLWIHLHHIVWHRPKLACCTWPQTNNMSHGSGYSAVLLLLTCFLFSLCADSIFCNAAVLLSNTAAGFFLWYGFFRNNIFDMVKLRTSFLCVVCVKLQHTDSRRWQRGYGATAARLTPDQKAGSSNLSALISISLRHCLQRNKHAWSNKITTQLYVVWLRQFRSFVPADVIFFGFFHWLPNPCHAAVLLLLIVVTIFLWYGHVWPSYIRFGYCRL